jgi:hypothetical protein
MFSGDMLFYYEKVSGANYNCIVKMSTMPVERLFAGGIMGPLSTIFSIIGAYLFYIVFRSINKTLAKSSFVLLASFFVFAGAYHAVFTNLGFIGRLQEPFRSQQLKIVSRFLNTIYSFDFTIGVLWTLIFLYLIIFKKTKFPEWIVLFTPTLLILLGNAVQNFIPYPLGAIIYGGWINLSFVLFYFICFIYFSKNNNLPESYIINKKRGIDL